MILSNPIGWCDDTTNAVTGCDKISPGCTHCYAAAGTRARVLRARGIETWGAKGVRHPVSEMAAKLRRLNKLCICDRCHQTAPYASHIGKRCPHCATSSHQQPESGSQPSALSPPASVFRRLRLFADSNSDWLDPKWPIETLANFLKEIWWAPHIDVLLLTKRPENWSHRLHQALRAIHDGTDGWISRWLDGTPPQGLWLGTSVENQKYAEERIPALLKIPAAIHFLSIEPLLTLTNLSLDPRPSTLDRINWVIVGGESGKNRRDCGLEPILNIAEQCRRAGVPCYVKQDCAFKSGQQGRIPAEIWTRKQFPIQRAASVPLAEKKYE